MMKKFFIIFVVLALCLCMCACGGPSPIYQDETLFERVMVFNDCSIHRHKGTNVLYVYMGSAMSVLFNADGTPMVWGGR